MKLFRFLTLAGMALMMSGCEEDPLVEAKDPTLPTPPSQGIQAFIQVDDDNAGPGERVSVWVLVQLGSETEDKLGSYTGRLRFDPQALSYIGETKIEDGMRVSNPNDTDEGEIRFAGASARGFNDLTLYQASFEVKSSDYLESLVLEMEELSAALSLEDLEPTLQVVPRPFLRSAAN